jgi:MarR family transcriptional regulator, organic hydroperoxide resistance regulator
MSKKLEFKRLSVHEGPKQSPGFLLWHISTAWRSRIETILKTLGLTHPQFVVLATTGWLTRNGALVTQVSIGKMAGLDPNTNSQVIKGLELKGLLKRVKSSDSRAKNVSLSPAGADVLSLALPKVEKADADFFHVLTGKELGLLVQAFQKLTPGYILAR